MHLATYHGSPDGIIAFLCLAATVIFIEFLRALAQKSANTLFCHAQSFAEGQPCSFYVTSEHLILKLPKLGIHSIIEYNQLHKFNLQEIDSDTQRAEPSPLTPLIDYIVIEFQGDDGSIQCLRFIQTEKDKKRNQCALRRNNILGLINARIKQAQDATNQTSDL